MDWKRHAVARLYAIANKIRRAYWFVFRPERHGVKVLVLRGDELLLVRHTYDGMWNLPGGGFNPKKESPERAGAREVKEELGLEVDCALLGKYVSTLEYKRDTVHCLVAHVDEAPIFPSGELAETAWFEIRKLPDQVSTAVKKTLEML